MKILYVITGLGGGGAEKVVCDLAEQMLLKGHQVKIAYLIGDVIVRPENKNIEIISLNLKSPVFLLKASQNYKKLLKIFKPDVVHAHMVHANIFARLNRVFHPVPRLICTAHSNNEGGYLRMFLYRITHSLSEVITNVSKSASCSFEKLGAVPKSQILTIYNGINLSLFKKNDNLTALKNELNFDESYYSFLTVGRFHEAKDYPNLLNAIALLKKQTNKKIIFYIAGDGELRVSIEKLINDLELKNIVHVLGRRDDIPQLMNIAKFFILSSAYEGFGLVVAEAMACESFVIATNCGGVAEIMGDTGILVPPKNSQALADAMKKAISLSQVEININNYNAQQRIKNNFSLEASVENWLGIYETK